VGPISIYCDWALHDELGDTVRLTEEMTLGVLGTLARWQADHAVSFDYYLLDAFWFEQPGDYMRFNPDTWPNGFDRALRQMRDLGLKPGLWLDTTGGRVTGHAPWAESIDANTNWGYCLFDGPYADGLRDAMLHACSEWGVRMFKFDFANFRAVTEPFRHLPEGEVYRRNVHAFQEVCRSVKAAYPDVVILAYNGFVHVADFINNTTGPAVAGISPGWLRAIDYLYSGDPRPADVACTSLVRAVDLYQDHMVAKFSRSGIPMDRIDDHGCMVGNTNTIYYRGKRGWRRSWVMTLARGSRKAHFYGDVHQLKKKDVEFLGKARELFFDLYRKGAGTRVVGPSVPPEPMPLPCQGAWHGFLTGGAEDGLLAVVNSSPEAVEAELHLPGLHRARLLFHDEGHEPDYSAGEGVLTVQLAPEQMALIGLGAKAGEKNCDLGTNVDGDPVPARSEPLDVMFTVGEGRAKGTVSGTALERAARGVNCRTLRASFVFRRNGQAARDIAPSEVPPSEAAPIEVTADGKPVAAKQLVPDVKIWSGCSWVTGLFPIAPLVGAEEVRIMVKTASSEVEIYPDLRLEP
jgi:hypothetical protein